MPSQAKQTQLGENEFNLLSVKTRDEWRETKKLKHHSPSFPPFSQTQFQSFLPDSFTFCPDEQWRGMRKESVHNSFSLLLLMLFPCSCVVSLWAALPFMNIHLLQCGVRYLLQHGPPLGRQGNNLGHHDLLQGLQENLCSGPCSTSSPHLFSHLGVFRAISHSFLLTPHSAVQHFALS